MLGDDKKTYYFDDIVAVKNERCYDDFEGPSLLNFQGLDGVLTAPEANPGANQINSSANCAKYIKSGAHAYSLILTADNGTPFDLATYNVFKIKVYATAPTSMIFKIEGTGGGFEQRKNIAVTNAWQEYYFRLFGASHQHGPLENRHVFRPRRRDHTDTYYFDDVCAVPSSCVGATANPDVIDDFGSGPATRPHRAGTASPSSRTQTPTATTVPENRAVRADPPAPAPNGGPCCSTTTTPHRPFDPQPVQHTGLGTAHRQNFDETRRRPQRPKKFSPT